MVKGNNGKAASVEAELRAANDSVIEMEGLQTRTKASGATVGAVLTKLRGEGWKFDYNGSGGTRKLIIVKRPEATSEKAPVAIPELGAQLQVTGLTLNVQNGVTSAILRNGKHAWAVELVAEVQ